MISCRICLKHEGNVQFEPVFASNNSLALQIYLVSGVKVIETEDNPAVICKKCSKDLQFVISFRLKCISADEFFRRKIPENFFDFSKVQNWLKQESSLQDQDEEAEQQLEEEVFTPEVRFKEENSEEVFLNTTFMLNQFELPASQNIKRQCKREKPKTREKIRHFCSQCPKSFKTYIYLVSHERIRHQILRPEELLKCDICNHTSHTRAMMRIHMNNRHLPKPALTLVCRACGKIFRSQGALYSHELTHVELDPADYPACNFCHKTFKIKRNLIQHVKLVHEKSKRIDCPHCPHVSTCKGALGTHIRTIHLKERNHTCQDCPAAFFHRSALIRHVRVHTGERPYQCLNEGCERRFPDTTGRHKHMKICPLKTSILENKIQLQTDINS